MSQTAQSLLVQLQRPDTSWVDVGLLRHQDNRNWFEFLPSYWDLPQRPILGQVFEEHGRLWQPTAHVALPRWFSHLLPEGRMREAVAHAAEVNKVREFELFRRLGQADLQGALRALPANSDGIAQVVPENENDDVFSPEDPLLKFSLAGVQLKYSILRDRRGLTIPARGVAGNVIAKLPDGRPGFECVPEAELASLELAAHAGLDTATGRLVKIEEIAGLDQWVSWVGALPILAVDRFDRSPSNNRIHMEELAQVLNIPTKQIDSKYKYANFETVANVAAALVGIEVVSPVIDRLVLNILVGNGDAHLKNWAFIYPDGRNAALSPLYDVVPTVLYIPNDDMGLKLGKTKRFEEVDITSFDEIGRRTGFGVSEARRQAASATARVLDHWDVLRQHLPSRMFDRLTNRLKTLPLARAAAS